MVSKRFLCVVTVSFTRTFVIAWIEAVNPATGGGFSALV